MEQVNLTIQKEPTTQKELTKQMRLSDMAKTHLTKQKEFTTQKGFTLIELAFVLVVMAIIAAFTTKAYLFQKAFEREEARADKTIQEIIQISEAMGGWRLDRGDWADVANHCVSAIDLLKKPPQKPATPTTPATSTNPTAYLRYVDTVSPYGTNYKTRCDANTFTIEVKSNKDYAQYIETKLAGTEIKAAPDDDTTITSIPRETINPTLADFLPFEGTKNNRQMSGDINMGRNAIINASDVEALNIEALNIEALNIKTSDIASEYIELDGQDIRLGIGKFVSMGSKEFDSLTATVKKPNCREGARTGTPKIIFRLHGVTTTQGSINGIRNVSWSAKFNDLLGTNQWQLSTTGLGAITGVAETFCDYGRWNRPRP